MKQKTLWNKDLMKQKTLWNKGPYETKL
jgi:hypothetical protein